jgi:hypothetical protein
VRTLVGTQGPADVSESQGRDATAEVERERKRIERELGQVNLAQTHKVEIKALVRELKDIVSVLSDATPQTSAPSTTNSA